VQFVPGQPADAAPDALLAAPTPEPAAVTAAAVAAADGADAADAAPCQSEWQMVMCGDIPLDSADDRAQCCRAHAPAPLPPAAAAAVSAARATQRAGARTAAAGGMRPDLDLNGAFYNAQLDYMCLQRVPVAVPVFAKDANGVTQTTVVTQSAPRLAPSTIARVKRRAVVVRALRTGVAAYLRTSAVSGLQHPGAFVGAFEVAALQARLRTGTALQRAALESLKSGNGVPPKVYAGGWFFPTNTPAGAHTSGPLAMAKVEADWGEFGFVDGGLNSRT
jgi:hypothetical protein